METRLIANWSELAAWRTEWDRLASSNPFRSWVWLNQWWQSYGTDPKRQPYVLLALEDQRLVGAAPWYRETTTAAGRQIRWLGSGEVCSDYVGIMSEPASTTAVVTAMADRLNESNHGSITWDLLHLENVDADDEATNLFVQFMLERECNVHQQQGMNCWRLDLPSSWDELLALMSKSHRKQLRRLERRVLDAGRARLHTVTNHEELNAAMPILVDLHQRRRKSLGQPGCFASASFDQFLHRTAVDLLEAGDLRLYWLSLDDRPVAAEFQLTQDKITYCYQAGVDPAAIEHEPGRLIMIATIKQAIDERQTAVDFLRGDEPYKAHWRAQPRPSFDYRIVSRRTVARVRHRMWQLGDTIKHWVKDRMTTATEPGDRTST